MGLIGVVGRKRARARLATTLLYALLTLGAVTTVYPFLVMVTTGTKGPLDQNDNRLVPAYWTSEDELYRKYVDDKYAGNLAAIGSTRGGRETREAVDTYRRFLATLPADLYTAGFRQPPSGIDSRLNTLYQAWLRRRFGSIEALNAAYIEEDTSFETVLPPTEAFARPHWLPAAGRKWDDWQLFKTGLPIEFRLPVTVRSMFQDFVRAEYRFSFSAVPADIRGGAKDFDQLEVPADGPELAAFEARGLPDRYRTDTVEARWLALFPPSGGSTRRGATNPTISPPAGGSTRRGAGGGGGLPADAVALAAGVRLPIEAFERAVVHESAGSLRREFATRNYGYVLRYLTVNGHALWTTVVFCGLAIVTTLGVNGLAAYALSRFPIRASGKILVFLLATMAFPAEVTMIPNFLLLKNLHLLNTFAALVLPGAASGFMIFMLKGFFDSLPPELFEAAALDGAREMTMMRRVAIPLSRPVFGYFALTTFMAAYGTFLYAFLVAQDRRMWTVMVFLYQLSGTAPKYVMMAAFTLAALPTLLVFLIAQRTIMRGIVLPSER
ncbi:MAG TPA: carbohydrate ABC transporter permease [Fimbriimonadaceae bacterium]|nr:carbohydrate ABC transporter permease [Fimbriimonadaceae bacterium]